jgi:peptidoglycan hydrolase-like protein with peptidoglycan-binding domain
MVLAAGISAVPAAAHDPTSQNDYIKKMQKELKEDGYYKGAVDGKMGPQTRQAIRDYQKANNLQGQGQFTRETAEHLGVVQKDDTSVGAKFENAGDAITDNYSAAGGAVAKGSKEMAGEVKEGEITQGAVDFGKGVGSGAKKVAKGTADAAVSTAKGVKDAFDGDSTERSRKADSKEK